MKIIARLFVLLASEPSVGVGDLDGQLSSPLNNQLPVLGRDIVGDLSTVGPTEGKRRTLDKLQDILIEMLSDLSEKTIVGRAEKLKQ